MFVFTEPSAQKFFFAVFSPNTVASASSSMGSPSFVPVPARLDVADRLRIDLIFRVQITLQLDLAADVWREGDAVGLAVLIDRLLPRMTPWMKSPSRFGIFQALQDHRADALARHEAVSGVIERFCIGHPSTDIPNWHIAR